MASPALIKILGKVAALAAKNPEESKGFLLKLVMVILLPFVLISVISMGMIGSFWDEGVIDEEFDVSTTKIYQDIDKVHRDYRNNLTEAQGKLEQAIIEANTYYTQEEQTIQGEYGKEEIIVISIPHCDVSVSKVAKNINYSYMLSYINHSSDIRSRDTEYTVDGKEMYKFMNSISFLDLSYGGKKQRIDFGKKGEIEKVLDEIKERGRLTENKSASLYNSILAPKTVAIKYFKADEFKQDEFLVSYDLYKDFLAYVEDGVEEVDFDTADPGYIYIPDEEKNEILDPEDDSLGAKVVAFALSKLGYPYSQPLRDSGTHYDCSSLTYYAYQSAGVSLTYGGANTAAAQAQYFYTSGKTVSVNNLKQGDLIFYSFKENGRFMDITHVAIYAGNGMVVDASSSKGYVVYRKLYSKRSIVLCGRY